ncbi:hypothetical protein JHK82_023458 [Glycine max]|nr:hypothetical protein JHK82_023458 [Glycine max]
MPFSLHLPTNHPSWNLPNPKQPTPTKQNLIFRRFPVFSSLRTSLDCVSDGGVEKGSSSKPIRLPFVVRSPASVSRFFWTGNCLQVVSVDGGGSAASDVSFDDRWLRAFGSVVWDFFIPRGVTGNYVEYVKWKLLHRVFSSALQVLATQAMFTAMGVGFSNSLPSAAALNWVLKDGLGRLSRCIYTASLASAFDTNLKSAVHQSFAIGDNLGEISAKAQIQTVCFDILGLMLAALVNLWIENHRRQQAGLHYFIYPFFAAMDLFGIYQGLKTVHLQTLTKDRLEIILSTWIECGYVPSPAEVSEKEGINFLGVKGKSLWPIRIGCLNPKDQVPKWSMKTIQCITDEDYYFVCAEIFDGLRRTGKACYIRKALLLNSTRWEIIIEESHASDSTMEDWSVIVEDAKRSTERDMSNLIEQMVGKGWMVKNILLSTQEQTRYNFVCD